MTSITTWFNIPYETEELAEAYAIGFEAGAKNQREYDEPFREKDKTEIRELESRVTELEDGIKQAFRVLGALL